MARDEWGKASPEEGIQGGREYRESVKQELEKLFREGPPESNEAVILIVGPSEEEIAKDAKKSEFYQFNAGPGTFAFIESLRELFYRFQTESIRRSEKHGTPSWEGVALKIVYPKNLVNAQGPGTGLLENVLPEAEKKADEKTIFSNMTEMPFAFVLNLHGVRSPISVNEDDGYLYSISYDRFDPEDKCIMDNCRANWETDSAIDVSKSLEEIEPIPGRAALGIPATCYSGPIAEEFRRSSKIGATYGTDESEVSHEAMDDTLSELAKIHDSILFRT